MYARVEKRFLEFSTVFHIKLRRFFFQDGDVNNKNNDFKLLTLPIQESIKKHTTDTLNNNNNKFTMT